MKINAQAWVRSLFTASGFALAGPAGALVGSVAGGLVSTVLPGASTFFGEALGRMASHAIERSSQALGDHLTAEEKLRINHDLQTAFRDSFKQALYDLGGRRCFPGAWPGGRRDVSPKMVYPDTPAVARLWRGKDPLADQVRDCLVGMERAVDEQAILPLDPPRDRPAAGVNLYLEAETPADLSNLFFEQVVAPYLAGFASLRAELPGFEEHLRRYLLDRTLVHLGESLKERTPAWRAYNRMMLEEVRREVRQAGAGQAGVLERLDLLLDRDNPAPFEELTDGLTDLLSAAGRLEKRLDEGFEGVLERAAAQHSEAMARFQVLIAASGRIETKVDRVLRMLEDGRYVIEGTPSVPVDAPPAPGEAPFKGLQFFDESDADLFFGREQLTAQLVSRLCENLRPSHPQNGAPPLNFLAVVGASGSGKSSLVRAGLIPAIKRGEPLADGSLPPPGCAHWPIHLITPSAHPLETLASSLARGEGAAAAEALRAELAADSLALRRHAGELLGRAQPAPEGLTANRRLLLVVDQFEELFTLCREETERKAFVDSLLAAAGEDGPLSVVVTLRADFYAHCSRYDNLRAALESHQVYIGPMSREELRSAIQEPARRGAPDGQRWEFEPGLVDLLLRDAGDEPGSLPLLSHALLETWKHRRARTMTLESYAEAGGVRGAIAKTAETVFFHRLSAGQQAIARDMFLRMTELGEETPEGLSSPDTRRRVALEELIPDPRLQPAAAALAEGVLKTLADARLVTLSEGTAEVAHEALIREWPTLRQWLDEDRAGLRLHRQLSEAALDWSRLKNETAVLYRGSRLAQALEWAQDHPQQLSELERRFLETSKAIAEQIAAEKEAARQRELEAARRLALEAEARRKAEADRARLAEQGARQLSARNRVITAVGALALLAAALAFLLALATGFFGLQSSRNAAQAGRNLATAQAAGTQAASESDTRATAEAEAIQQKIAAEAASGEAVRQSRISLARELAARSMSVLERDQDLGLLLAIEAVRIANQIPGASIPEAQTALYHALEVARFSRVLRGHSKEVWFALFSPDGKQILTGSEDGTARLWTAQGELAATLSGHTDQVLSAAFNASGTRVATASKDGTVRLWRSDGSFIESLQAHSGLVSSVSFSPDGQRLLTAGGDNTAKLWRVDGTLLKTLEGHSHWVTLASFSPDGSLIATASLDNTLRLWDAEGAPLAVLEGHTGWPAMFAFSPDGSKIVSAGWDGTARLWSAGGEALATLEGHTRSVNSAFFSPDGQYLLTSSYDNLARLWTAEGEFVTALEGHNGPIVLAVFSPDGSRLLTSSWDNTARLWQSDGTLLSTLRGHSDWVYTALFSPDGSQIVTASADGTARLWDARQLYPETLPGHTSTVSSAFFSPDGEMIVTAGTDSTARLWRSDGAFVREIAGLKGPLASAIFSPDGRRLLVSCFDKVAQVWNLDGSLVTTLEGHSDQVSWASYSPDGSLIVTASYDGTARLWESNGAFLRALEGHADALNMAVFSPDGRKVLTASDDFTARLWLTDGTLVAALEGHTAPVRSAVFSPDGSRLLTAAYDRTARLWSAEGKPLQTLEGHPDLLSSATFSPDGSLIVTTSVDGTAWLWRAGGEFIASLEGHRSWVTSASFSPDGARIVTTSNDGTARLWGVHGDVPAMLAEAQARVGRALSELECQRYLHLEACPASP